MDQLGAVDIGSFGAKFTWHNNRADSNRIYKRLDKTILSPNWGSSLPKSIF